MSMTAGSVVVDFSGAITGSGFALALFNAMVAAETGHDPQGNALMFTRSDVTGATAILIKQYMARQATAFATTITYIQANAQAVISTSLGSLQTLPNPPTAGSATTAPSAQRVIPIQ